MAAAAEVDSAEDGAEAAAAGEDSEGAAAAAEGEASGAGVGAGEGAAFTRDFEILFCESALCEGEQIVGMKRQSGGGEVRKIPAP